MSTTYRSTRGGVNGFSFEQAILSGLAADRGLFVPETIPKLPANALETWANLSYEELAVEVMSLFIGDNEIPRKDLQQLVAKAYKHSDSNFRDPAIAPVVKVKEQLYMLELFHGPTFAFKDVALQFLGHLFEYFLERKNRLEKSGKTHRITVVGATSGDTGSAAIYGLRNKKNVEVFIMYPHGRVSAIQEQQMACVLDENIHNLAVKGTFDDCQAIVKDCFADAEFKQTYSLGAVNSINWARILAQIVYYFYAYFRISDKSKKIAFSVPTGNFGDILAGFYAMKLGLPMEKLIVATNDNDILHRFFSTGAYHRTGVEHTISPSMDICVSSNFERYLFALCGDNACTLKQWMDTFETTGKLTVEGPLLAKAKAEMVSFSVLQPDVLTTIKEYHQNYSYVLDPHSAIGVAAGDAYLKENDDVNVVVLATAHYGKFMPTVLSAFDTKVELPQHPILKALESLPQKSKVMENSVEVVQDFVREVVPSNQVPKCVFGAVNHFLPQSTLLKASIVLAVGAIAFAAVQRSNKN
ncbi:threonine synthase [Thraustotheca clavata]|uniref:threonine synthase n=1 Tax=Thraustotheca clavata TaxID=74557 RepID=A0A1V9YLM1_9STRA|nr:threonine synthase [Thraustotheca clavata]